nr:retrovirus-related Pol polyprotein from transposon TNT 1-94 [Tanacetum cinerariifolium]
MANLSEDIQCAGSDTRPSMFDRTDFASWQHVFDCILGVKRNILKSIDEGPFQMGIFRETLAEGTKGAFHLGHMRQCEDAPGRFRINQSRSGITTGRFVTSVKLNRGLRDSNYDQLYAYLKQHEAHANENKMMLDRFTQHTVDPLALMFDRIEERGTIHGVEVQLGIGEHRTELGMLIQVNQDRLSATTATNGVALDEEQLLFLAGGQDNAIDEDVDEQPVQDLSLNVDNVFQADNCDAFDSDVDEAHTSQTMFMANLSSADPVYDEAEHEMHDNVQPNHVVDSHADYTSDSNMIPYDQYVKDNAVPGVQIADNSLTAKLATYKEQVELYERRARFKLKEREQKIDEQLRIVITNRNIKKETLKKELHSVKLQLASTINHNKSMVEEVTSLKKDFKQKENKYLEEFLDMKSFKEKVEDRLYKQDQTLQTVYMLFKPKPYYNELNKNLIKPLKRELHQLGSLKGKGVLNKSRNVILKRFTKMHVAHTIVEACCLELKAELSNLRDKIHNDNHNELVNRFSNLEVHHLNLQLKYQNLKDSFRNNPPTPAKDTLDFNSVFAIGKMQASLQGKDNVIKKMKTQISHLQETRWEAGRTLDFRALDFQITQLNEKVTVLQEQNDMFRAKNKKIKQHYKELYDSIKITRVKNIEQTTALTTENVNLKAQILNNVNSVIKDHVKPTVLAPGKYAIDVEPIPPCNRNNKEVHLDYLRHLKESVETLREIVEEAKVVRPLDSLIVSACRYPKHSQELLEYEIGTCSNTHKHVAKLNTQKTNVSVPPSIGVNHCTDASGSQPRSNTKKNKISPAKGVNKMKVEEHPRTNKSHLRTINRVDSSSRSKRTKINLNSDYLSQFGNLSKLGKYGNPHAKYLPVLVINGDPQVVQIVLWYLDSGCSKHMTGDRSWLMNFVKKFIGTVRLRNDHFGAIMGYGDYAIGDSVISRVYYVEGLGHNLFSVGQFCDSDLEVSFRKHSCYVRDTDGVELIKGSRGFNLYTISVEDMMKSSPICLLSKASKNKSWLWHRRLNHLNFDTINDLARKDLVRGLPRLKFKKDRLCSACQQGKSKKHTHKPKTKNTNLEVLNTLHMDLCGPIRVKFLRSKDETPEVVIKFLQQIQVDLNKTVRYIRTDNGTKFVNKALTEYYERVGIFYQKSVPRTPQQNDVVKRRNRTLVEAGRTMLIFSKALMFLWAEAVATACYTQNRSFIHTRHNKTPYELVHNKKPDLTFFRVFGALCYPTNDNEDLGKLQPTANIRIFIGYAPSRKGLVPNSVPTALYVPPTTKYLEILFQPMFDEYLEPPRVERPVSPAPAVQVPVTSARVATESTLMENNPVAPVNNNPFINVFAPEPSSDASSSGDVSSAESTYVSQTLHHLGHGTNPRGGGAAGYGGVQNRVGNANPGQARQNSEYYKDKMLLMQAQENRVALDAKQLLFLADPVNDKAGPSYDLDILSEDAACENHEEHAMHDNVQLNHVFDSHADYTGDSNIIPYDQYVKDNAVPVVHTELSNLRDKSYNANHDELVNRFSNLEYAIDVEPIVPCLRNNRVAHLDYLRHLKESVKTICDIVEEVKVVRPLDSSIVSACRYTKHFQELLEYAIGTCPQDSHQRDKKHAPAPLIRKKQVTFIKQCDKSNSNTYKHVAKLNTQKTNVYVPPSTGVKCCTDASRSHPRSNTKKNRISSAKGVNKIQVEKQPRTNKSHLKTSNRVDSSSRPKRTKTNVHVPPSTGVNCCTDASGSHPRSNTKKNRISPAKGVNKMQVEKQPRTNKSHLKTSNRVDSSSRPKRTVVQIILWYLDSGCSKHMTRDRSRFMNFVKKFIGTVRFGNDHFGDIMGYGDYMIGDSVISRVYYMEGLGQNLFSVRQFCDSDLEVAFRKHSCYVRDTDVQAPVNSAGTPSSTTIDQDAPSPSISPSSSALQSHSLHQGIAAKSTFMEDNLVAPVDNNPFINVFTPEPSSDTLSSGDVNEGVPAELTGACTARAGEIGLSTRGGSKYSSNIG